MGELYKELYDYGTLENAFECAYLYLTGEYDEEEREEWLINLQNRLIWKEYEPGTDPDEDCVVLTAIQHLLKAHGMKSYEVEEPELRRIIADLTLE